MIIDNHDERPRRPSGDTSERIASPAPCLAITMMRGQEDHEEIPQKELHHLPENNYNTSPTKVYALSKTSSSIPNLALLLVHQLFTGEEMASSNCRTAAA